MNRLKCFAIFKNVAHSLEPGETPCNSAFHPAS